MTRTHYNYPKTKRFDEFLHNLQKGKYGNETLTVTSTTKLHGSNLGFVYDNEDFYLQSRNNVISDDADFNGVKELLGEAKLGWIRAFLKRSSQRANGKPVVLFCEVVGKGICKGSAINKVDRNVFSFELCYVDGFKEHDGTPIFKELPYLATTKLVGIDTTQSLEEVQFQIRMDVSDKELREKIVPLLNKRTLEVEQECPIAKELGVEGNGEGVVWRVSYGDGNFTRFKTVSSVFSSRKSEPKAPVQIDPEVATNRDEVLEIVLTQARVNQGKEEVGYTSMREFGKLIKWVTEDILSEEKQLIEDSEVPWKLLHKAIPTKLKVMV